MEKVDNKIYSQNRVYELIFKYPKKYNKETVKIDLENLIKTYTKNLYLYKAFVKLHFENGGHLHLMIYLGKEKPKYKWSELLKKFSFGDLELDKVNISKLSQSTRNEKKFMTMVKYVTDGHDNGTFKDTLGWKCDPELELEKDVEGKALLFLSRGETWNDIIQKFSWSDRYKLINNKTKIISAFREYQETIEPYVFKYKMYDCQKSILGIFKDKNVKPGNVCTIFDPEGQNGKSTIAEYLAMTDEVNTLRLSNQSKKSIASLYTGQRNIIFDYTRTDKHGKTTRPNYNIIEQLCNGHIISEKYRVKNKSFKIKPKVLVLVNSPLDWESLSLERWRPFIIKERKLFKDKLAIEEIDILKEGLKTKKTVKEWDLSESPKKSHPEKTNQDWWFAPTNL